MVDFRLSRAARNDLAEMLLYSEERFGRAVAEKYLRGLRDALRLLQEYPQSGRVQPVYGPNVRCKFHRSHRIFYRFDKNTIYVQRILHHSRDAARHLTHD